MLPGLRPPAMDRWNEITAVVAWLTFVTVWAYPLELEDNLFMPEQLSTYENWFMPDPPLSFDEMDDVTTYPVTLTGFDYSGEDVGPWDYDVEIYSSSEPFAVDTSWSPYNLAAMDSSECLPNVGKRDTATESTLGNFTFFRSLPSPRTNLWDSGFGTSTLSCTRYPGASKTDRRNHAHLPAVDSGLGMRRGVDALLLYGGVARNQQRSDGLSSLYEVSLSFPSSTPALLQARFHIRDD